MHIEKLLTEVRNLSDRFVMPEARPKPEAPIEWHSARGLLDIVLACGRISDISTRISAAGYWECDRELLAQIGAQSRQILYHINDMKAIEAKNIAEGRSEA
ncbi:MULTISPECIES: hypothetical protein [unclassified Rhizobium]|uniref:hypothetical protein n=1 Tax=unclassified Rhizobium TaxID=2613769 RepID=UPI001ADA819C|nr:MULTISPECIES: hypothetical protein [unclassified Rhizobium]MBO9097090.1 hypothetical protein [Rhizobium sp. L58/93]MBO9134058.1 hypothetical protein [Rhizobium sp. B209b/85]MBO9167328.1 hypothetical protein [Rhizobium sp. L245/93]MBO9183287.1 hypothetical protein [Rhizobium sp. E27B/91]QXZ83628.1 hypothetical protein J5287_16565 [Rhizobium sp. K1/93]